MQNVDHLGSDEPLHLEAMVRKIRSGYLTFFGAPAVCATAAIFFAVGHEWLYAAAFLFSTLIYFPVSLSQYRQSKKVCEDVIRKYRQWHQENGTNTGH